jgi:hypothetical protein
MLCRSLNDGECSADWYNFQESVAHLQLLEEEVLESHKNLVDSMEHWMNQDISLLAMSNEVDYDQDGEFIDTWPRQAPQVNIYFLYIHDKNKNKNEFIFFIVQLMHNSWRT